MITLKNDADDPYARSRAHLLGLLGMIAARGTFQFLSDLGRRIFLDVFMLSVRSVPSSAPYTLSSPYLPS
jgi:hypothetical protein